MAGANDKILHSNISYRIRIGVTGHRVLPDTEELSEKVKEVLETRILDLFGEDSKRLIRSSPHTQIAFSILTPLAEGADRLVAREVLKLPNSTIEVVLPLAKADYLQDFETEESRREFEELLQKARRPTALRKQTLREEFPKGDLPEARRQAYEDIGRYTVSHCDVLIALWDGKESRGKGGTAEIIAYAKTKKRPVIIISTIAPYNISVEKGYGLNANSISEIEMFNSFPLLKKEQQAYIENMYKYLFDPEEGRELPEETKSNVREKLLPFYVRASKIAKRNQKFYQMAGLLVYSFATIAVMAVALGTLFYEEPAWVAFFIELVLLSAIFFIVFFSDRRRTHKKWLESRFLAERIRSAIFLAACGVEASPIHIPPYMGSVHQSGDWTVMAFNEIWGCLPIMKGCQGQSCRALGDFIRRLWIQDQIEYHKDKSEKAEKVSHRLEVGGMIIFVIALIAPLFHLLLFHPFDLLGSLGDRHGAEWLENVLIFVALSLPAVGAAIGGIRTHREYSRLAKRSENMKVVLEELDERFQGAGGPEALESLLRETEELMLLEVQDWLMLMRFCELEHTA